MRKISRLLFFFTIFVFNMSFLLPLPANAQKDAEKSDKFRSSKNAIPNRYIVVLNEEVVQFNDLLPAPMKGEMVNRVSQDLVSRFGGGRVDRIYAFALKGFAAEMSRESALRLSQDARVKFVEEDFRVYKDQQSQPNATWGLDRIDQRSRPLNQTYSYTTTGAGVHAYILDSGIRATHAEFTGRLGNGADFIGDGQNGNDCDGHGTHVAGTVGGTTYGVAKQVILHNVRVLGCDGTSANSSVLNGIDWVVANHIKPAVINMSLGGSYSSASNAAVSNAVAQGLHVVVSAGNENNDACDKSPASAPEAITVGATDINDNQSVFSNYGNCVDIFAPGSQITSASHQSDTGTAVLFGTSMAAPHVAGAVARFLETNPAAPPSVTANSVINSATNGAINISSSSGSPNKLLFADVTLNNNPQPAPIPTPAPAVRINESGPATPYPSELLISGRFPVLGSEPNSLEIYINGFSHTYPDEVSLVLEGPTGARMLLQNGAGGGEDANNINYQISDTGMPMPTASKLQSSWTYKPTAINLTNFPAPGPGTSYNNPGPVAGGTATLASTFGGTNPNGIWKLYVYDANLGDRGRIQNWSIQTREPSLPNSPGNLRATPVSDTQINVSWDPAPAGQNIVGYNLRIDGGTWITGITSNSYQATGLRPGTFYTFEVVAIDSYGRSSSSSRATATTSGEPVPNPPLGLSATVFSSSQINVTWDAPPHNQNVLNYNLRINGSQVLTGIWSRSYLADGLTPNTAYTFEVQAVNTKGNVSQWSAPVSAATTAGPPPAPTPTPPPAGEIILTASPDIVIERGSVKVSYNSKSDRPSFDEIRMYLVGSPDSQSLGASPLPAGRSGTLDYPMAVSPGNYEFRYFMRDNPTPAAISNPVKVVSQNDPSVPLAPVNLRAEIISLSQINVFWDAAPASQNVVSYNLTVNGYSTNGIAQNSFQFMTSSCCRSYTFQAQAVNASGLISGYSNPITVTLPSTPPEPTLTPPSLVFTDTVSASQINVFWNAVNGATGYNLRINGGQVISNIRYTSFPVTGLQPNAAYSFEVQAINSAGLTSGWSQPVNAATPNPLSLAPPNLIFTDVVSASQINVFWNAATDAARYNLRINGSLVVSNIAYTSFPVTGLNPATGYTFEIQSVSSNGAVSNWSQIISATTKNAPATLPPPNVVFTDVVSSAQINVFWNVVGGAASYNLRINGSPVISNIAYTSFPVTNLNPSTTYTFEIQAVSPNGALSDWSQIVSAVTRNAPATLAPPNLIFTDVVSASQINVFWNAVDGAARYNLKVNGSFVIPNIAYTSFPATNLNPATGYAFEVQAVSAGGALSGWSQVATGTTQNASSVILPPNVIFAEVVSSSQLNVFWNAVGGATSYDLRINGGQIISNIAYTSFPVTGLSANSTYAFEVRAVNNTNGTMSDWSQIISAKTAGSGGGSAVFLYKIPADKIDFFDQLAGNARWRLK